VLAHGLSDTGEVLGVLASGVLELARSLLPGIVAAGVATEEEVDIDTLAERLRAGSGSVGRVAFWPTVVGAFATKPA
jgi:hypothetical protein